MKQHATAVVVAVMLLSAAATSGVIANAHEAGAVAGVEIANSAATGKSAIVASTRASL